MMMKRCVVAVAVSFVCAFSVEAQTDRLVENVQYGGSMTGTAGGGSVPFWFTSNRFGLGALKSNSVLASAYLKRDAEADSLRYWKVGYGIDLAAGYGLQSYFNIQQAYVDAGWRMINLSIGQKQRPSELKNPVLSTGGLTLGQNARPLPQVRLELPDFWTVPGTKGFLSLKAHIAYGLYMDNGWQRSFTEGTKAVYTRNSWFHSKALFVRIGNEKKFPLIFTGGLEMACQFGGQGYNIRGYLGEDFAQGVPLAGNLWTAFVPGKGGDISDEAYTNAAGNHIGSWHLRLDWIQRSWNVGIYAEHLFEDESQMFMQYGFWKDMLIGMEANLPKNCFVSTVLYEYNNTMDQSGPIYHDHTVENPIQISARDNYYNNSNYGAWQHAGFVMGNPTLISPLYNNGSISVLHSRIQAHHVGVKGDPAENISWRILYTHEKSLGTYHSPVTDPVYGDFLLIEASYRFKCIPELGLTLAYGHNGGGLLGKGDGALLTVSWDGWIRRLN